MTKEQLLSQEVGKESTKQTSSDVLTKIDIEGTPLTFIKPIGKKAFIAFGMYMLTNPDEVELKDEKEAKKYVKQNVLNIACNMAVIIADKIKGDK